MAGIKRESKQAKAAELLAEGELTFEEIADRVGIARTTFYNWRRDPEFQADVRERRAHRESDTFSHGAALRFRRVRGLKDVLDRLYQVIEDRSEDPALRKVSGGKTGLITMNFKGVGVGQAARVVPIFEVDTGLLSEVRNFSKQIAQETGQWSDKTEVSGPDGGPMRAEVSQRVLYVDVHQVSRNDGAEPAPGVPEPV